MPDRPATLRDVAAAAGVHPATASRALNPETRLLVSEETAQRVVAAAGQLGYRPNPVARSLRTRRSNTVGVLIPDLNNPIFPPIVRGLEDKLAAAGYVALLGNTDADAGRERTIFEQDRRVVESQRPERVPFDLAAEMHLKFDAVAINYRRAMREQGLARRAQSRSGADS